MSLKNEVLQLIKIAEGKHINDPTISVEMDRLTALLLQDPEDTIALLDSLELQELLWLSSDFEELSYKFQSSKFVNCLKELDKKFPRKMSPEIQRAIEAYFGNN